MKYGDKSLEKTELPHGWGARSGDKPQTTSEDEMTPPEIYAGDLIHEGYKPPTSKGNGN